MRAIFFMITRNHPIASSPSSTFRLPIRCMQITIPKYLVMVWILSDFISIHCYEFCNR
jgi:hypothetical protein